MEWCLIGNDMYTSLIAMPSMCNNLSPTPEGNHCLATRAEATCSSAKVGSVRSMVEPGVRAKGRNDMR